MPAAAATQVRRDEVAVCIPIIVWLDGHEPDSAANAKVCLVARKCARVRLKEPFPVNTVVRLKVPARSRSATGRVSAVFAGPAGEAEIAIFADSLGSYLGIAFPDTKPEAEATPQPPPPAPAAPPASAPERPAAVSPALRPIGRSIEVTVQGRERRGLFSQTVTARLDASGCFDVALAQDLEPGIPVRVCPANPAAQEEWLCQISYRSSKRNAQGLWEYRLSF